MDMVVGLTLYLLKQGYRPGDITVLTPYLKQLANIRVGIIYISIYSIHYVCLQNRHSYAPTAYGLTFFVAAFNMGQKAALSKTVLTFADEEDEAALDALQDLEAQQAAQPQSEQKKGREEEKGLTQASARDRVRTATIDK
jgi:hypothetical protein